MRSTPGGSTNAAAEPDQKGICKGTAPTPDEHTSSYTTLASVEADGWSVAFSNPLSTELTASTTGNRNCVATGNYYAWTNGSGVGQMIKTMTGSGTGVLTFGNCGDAGEVKVYMNGAIVAAAATGYPQETYEFTYANGDVLKIRDEGANSVVLMSSLNLTAADGAARVTDGNNSTSGNLTDAPTGECQSDPDDLNGQVFSGLLFNGYTYSISVGTEVTELGTGTSPSVSCGTYSSTNSTSLPKTQLYTSGTFSDGCDGSLSGQQRVSMISFYCGESTQITAITEAVPCDYSITFETPGCCRLVPIAIPSAAPSTFARTNAGDTYAPSSAPSTFGPSSAPSWTPPNVPTKAPTDAPETPNNAPTSPTNAPTTLYLQDPATGICPSGKSLTEAECASLDGQSLGRSTTIDYKGIGNWPNPAQCGCYFNSWNPANVYFNTRTEGCTATNAAPTADVSCGDQCSPSGSDSSPVCTQSYCDHYQPGGTLRLRCDSSDAGHHYALAECKDTCGLCPAPTAAPTAGYHYSCN